jgi:hypothetical protein
MRCGETQATGATKKFIHTPAPDVFDQRPAYSNAHYVELACTNQASVTSQAHSTAARDTPITSTRQEIARAAARGRPWTKP